MQLLASYGARRLRRMLTGVHETLRSAGRDLELEPASDPQLEARIEELRGGAAAASSRVSRRVQRACARAGASRRGRSF